MRLMSFMLTTAQVLERSKTVTRRVGWLRLRAGAQLQPVEKGMGLKKGERVRRLGPPVTVVDVRRERLDAIDSADVAREGFAELSPAEFVEMFCRTHQGCRPDSVVTRIEFKYSSEPATDSR